MRIPKRFGAALAAAALATLALAGVASADHPGSYSLFGDAEYVEPGNGSPRAVQIRSDAVPGYGGIDFDIPAGTTFADLTELSTDFMPEDAIDLCLGGSPRFQINVELDLNEDGLDDNIFAYFGPDSGSAACIPAWQNTSDLLETGKLLDTSQVGGTFYDPYDNAVANYGSLIVTGVQVVVDSAWIHLDAEQTFIIDNTSVDGHLYTYERAEPRSADDCKDGGWMELADGDGNAFRNQGQCIKYANGAGGGGGGGVE